MEFIKNLFSSNKSESVKRVIAMMFTIAMIAAYFTTNDVALKNVIVYCYSVLIALLLGLATAETITNLFTKK